MCCIFERTSKTENPIDRIKNDNISNGKGDISTGTEEMQKFIRTYI